jgi:hypothetical protein
MISINYIQHINSFPNFSLGAGLNAKLRLRFPQFYPGTSRHCGAFASSYQDLPPNIQLPVCKKFGEFRKIPGEKLAGGPGLLIIIIFSRKTQNEKRKTGNGL